MADDKTKRGGTDRAKVSGSEPYEVDYFAKKHGLSRDRAQALIERVGNNREVLDAAASEAKRSSSGGDPAPAKRRRASARESKATASSRVPAVAATVDAITEALVDPIAKATRPTRRKVAATTGKAAVLTKRVGGETRRAVGQATNEVAKAPAKLQREVMKAAKAVTPAVSGRSVASLVGAATVGIVAGVALSLNRQSITAATGLLDRTLRADGEIGARTTLAERIARVLAGTDASVNAEGDAASAGSEVDALWRSHLPQALAVLRTLRAPSSEVAGSGDAQVWETMVLAAIAEGDRV